MLFELEGAGGDGVAEGGGVGELSIPARIVSAKPKSKRDELNELCCRVTESVVAGLTGEEEEGVSSRSGDDVAWVNEGDGLRELLGREGERLARPPGVIGRASERDEGFAAPVGRAVTVVVCWNARSVAQAVAAELKRRTLGHEGVLIGVADREDAIRVEDFLE